MSGFIKISLLALLAACASTPRAPPGGNAASGGGAPLARAPAQAAAPSVSPSAQRQAEVVCPEQPPAVPENRGRLVQSSWAFLPDWQYDNLSEAWPVFLKSCSELAKKAVWQAICAQAQAIPPNAEGSVLKNFFENNFTPYQALDAGGGSEALVTGYYEPLLQGSRSATKRYRYPLYTVPDDLIEVDLEELFPELRHKRIRGRLEGHRLVAYYTRAQIDAEQRSPLHGRELVWVDDPIELFFLQIQGSGRIQLANGQFMRVGYADQNGHPFRSIGRLLVAAGELRRDELSLQGIKQWARNNPAKVGEFLNANPSYVFFRELPLDLNGPLGTLGVPLTAGRSLAVDNVVVPLGAPVYLATTWPGSVTPLNRLMMAQDTGGAISGAARADFFWGFGDEAGRLAGAMRQGGRMWVLLPRDYNIAAP
jgi:peptidoglycan lytic transglycosylase A